MILQCRNQRPEQALEMGLVHELAPVAEVVERARQWVLTKGDPEQPWDKKGFKIPGGGLTHPGTAQTFMVGNALVAKNTKHKAQLPCPDRGPVRHIRGLCHFIRRRPEDRIPVLRLPAGRAGCAQYDAQPVRQQGQGR
jgi:hypothetical protein